MTDEKHISTVISFLSISRETFDAQEDKLKSDLIKAAKEEEMIKVHSLGYYVKKV